MGKQGVISWVPLALACAEGPACSQGRGGWGERVPKVTPCPGPSAPELLSVWHSTPTPTPAAVTLRTPATLAGRSRGSFRLKTGWGWGGRFLADALRRTF